MDMGEKFKGRIKYTEGHTSENLIRIFGRQYGNKSGNTHVNGEHGLQGAT